MSKLWTYIVLIIAKIDKKAYDQASHSGDRLLNSIMCQSYEDMSNYKSLIY